jgi:hypothetical protein
MYTATIWNPTPVGLCVRPCEVPMKPATTEAEMVRLLQAGNETAFRNFIDRYGPRIYRLAYRILSNRDDAEDIAQEVFAKVYSSINGFQTRGSPPNTVHDVLVPTALERKGDFSQSLNNSGQKLTFINDPLNGAPFPGMMVPQSRFYAQRQALLNLFPLPNTPQVSNFNYTSQVPGEAPRQETLLRMDYNVTEKLRVFAHWTTIGSPPWRLMARSFSV